MGTQRGLRSMATEAYTGRLQEELLSWEMQCELAESEAYDTIICATVSSKHIFVGTYGEVGRIYPPPIPALTPRTLLPFSTYSSTPDGGPATLPPEYAIHCHCSVSLPPS